MSTQLLAKFTEEEVTTILNLVNPTKAPGLNGMAPIFYQKYLDIVGKDATNSILIALNMGMFPTSLNHTFITLIPKKRTPERIFDYRLSVFIIFCIRLLLKC